MAAWRRKRGGVAIADKEGRQFSVHTRGTDGFWAFQLFRMGWLGFARTAGKANLVCCENGEFLIGNLEVAPEYQSAGTGSAFLLEVTNLAERHGATLIYGNICAEDRAATPHLLRFYERNGFLTRPPREPKWVATVERVVRQSDG